MEDANKYKQLSAREFKQWMNENRSFYLIDTLPEDHFQKIHLPGADNACVYQVIFLELVKAITDDINAVIVLYGSGSKSLDAVKAAEKLAHEGFQNIYILDGGIEAWKSAGYSLEGEYPETPDDPHTRLKLEDRTYIVDTGQSSIVWTGRNPSSTHFGNIKIAGGELKILNSIITGTFDIDMHSISNTNLDGDELQPVLTAHLKSDDFFLADKFPRASFSIDRGKPGPESYVTYPNYDIQGTLDLRGTKAEQTFMATVAKTPDNTLSIEAHFDIDRTRWNVVYGSTRFFEHLGMHLVFDLISIQLRIIAH